MFFRGHSNPVSAVAVSRCGKFLASGQVTHMGYKAAIHVYTLADHKLYATFTLHKVKIESLVFSCDSKLLYSLGGQDDGSVVVWDLETKQSICGNPVAPQTAGAIIVLEASNKDPCSFITGMQRRIISHQHLDLLLAGEKSIRVWRVDIKNRKLLPEDCNLGTLKRNVQSVAICPGRSEISGLEFKHGHICLFRRQVLLLWNEHGRYPQDQFRDETARQLRTTKVSVHSWNRDCA